MPDNNNELLSRQEQLGLNIPKAVAVVGCGGVGSWTAYMLAMAGVPELWLFDYDQVSEHNRNRLPVPPDAVGQLKSNAVADIIKQVRPDCLVYACGGFSVELAIQLQVANKLTWVVATTDTWASRKMVYDWAMNELINYIEAAAEGEFGSVTGSPAEWATPEEEQPGYASVPVWVGSAVMAAAAACYHVLHDTGCRDLTHRMGWDQEAALLSLNTHDPHAVDDEEEEEPDPYASQESAAADGWITDEVCRLCHTSTTLSCSNHPGEGAICARCVCPQCVAEAALPTEQTGLRRNNTEPF